MASEGSLFASPFFWLAVSGLLFGAGWGRILRPYKGSGDKGKYKIRGFSLFFLSLGLAAAAGLCAFFLPGPALFFDIRLAYWFGAISVLAFFGSRFPGICGIPLLVITTSLAGFLGLFLDGWMPIGEGIEALSYKVLSYQNDSAKLELSAIGLEPNFPVFIETSGDRLEVSLSVLIFSDYFSAINIQGFARIESIRSSKSELAISLKQSFFDKTMGRDRFFLVPGILVQKSAVILTPIFVNSESIRLRIDSAGVPSILK